MINTEFILLVHVIVWKFFLANAEIQLQISNISTFPIGEGENFSIDFTPVDKGSIISDSIHDTMVIQVTDMNGKEMEKSIFDYGFKEAIDQEYRGTYMRIPVWQKYQRTSATNSKFDENGNYDTDRNMQGSSKNFGPVLSVVIVFSRLANNHMIYIYQIPAKTPGRRRQFISNLNLSRLIHKSRIDLLIASKLDLSIRTLDGRRGELMLYQPGIVTCRAYDGFPVQKPFWVNMEDFKVVPDDQGNEGSFSSITNTREVQITVTVVDHLKELKCRAGSTVESVKIIVLHHPSQISLEPEIAGFVPNGTNVVCSAVDGYPQPDIAWHFVTGPTDAERFFNVSKDGKTLHITFDAPQGSHWMFNCSASNRLPRSFEIFNRTVSFSIGSKQEGLFGLNLTFQIMIGVAILAAIIVFCFVIVFIVCIVRRSKCIGGTSPSSRNSRRNGAPGKVVTDKKSLEAEQVTLLPPGGQLNHLDMANVGSGLPPPPPEYQLLLENDINHVVPMEQQVGNDAYAEVTYAELNTSYLPMKEKKAAALANVKDDQVIYSQIIGTMATPQDCVKRGYMDVDNQCDIVMKDNGKGYKSTSPTPIPAAAAATMNDDQVIYSQIIGTMTTGTQDCV